MTGIFLSSCGISYIKRGEAWKDPGDGELVKTTLMAG
jgi:hypothetical protein